MLQETPGWLAERLGCSREVLEYPTQVSGCSGEIFGCLSKLLVQHGEVLVRTKAVMGDTERCLGILGVYLSYPREKLGYSREVSACFTEVLFERPRC